MTYNLTNVTNATSPPEFVEAMNDASGGLVGIMILTAIFVLSYMGLTRLGVDTQRTSILSFFVTTFFSVMAWALNWIAWEYSIVPVILFFISIAVSGFRE